MGAPYKISAWKKAEDERYLVSCDVNDEDACSFEISYFIRSLGFSAQKKFKSKSEAEDIIYLLNIAWDEGRREAFADLRNFIGVK